MSVKHLKYLTKSDKETVNLGKRLGALLTEGDLVAMTGVLGSGKTWFTKGIALGLDISPDTVITSPSFSLVNEYNCRSIFYHMDLYRLENLEDVLSSGIEEYLHKGGVVAMEWADRWPQILPDKKVEVRFDILDDCERNITISGNHPRAREIIDGLLIEAD